MKERRLEINATLGMDRSRDSRNSDCSDCAERYRDLQGLWSYIRNRQVLTDRSRKHKGYGNIG